MKFESESGFRFEQSASISLTIFQTIESSIADCLESACDNVQKGIITKSW